MKLFSIVTLLVLLSTTAKAADYEVKLVSSYEGAMMAMVPAFLQVQPGDTVTFVPQDATHNAVAYSVPEGAEKFESALGETIQVTFEQQGLYLYKCTPHILMGMLGVIQVGEAVNLQQAQQDWQKIKPSVLIHSDKLQSIMDGLQ